MGAFPSESSHQRQGADPGDEQGQGDREAPLGFRHVGRSSFGPVEKRPIQFNHSIQVVECDRVVGAESSLKLVNSIKIRE